LKSIKQTVGTNRKWKEN